MPFLAPMADEVWAGQCCDPSCPCPSSAVPTTPGSVGESVGVLLVVTVFGSTDGMDMEGAEVVLAMKDFQNPVLSAPLRNIEMHYLFFTPTHSLTVALVCLASCPFSSFKIYPQMEQNIQNQNISQLLSIFA